MKYSTKNTHSVRDLTAAELRAAHGGVVWVIPHPPNPCKNSCRVGTTG